MYRVLQRFVNEVIGNMLDLHLLGTKFVETILSTG